jgi:hypothetical protein
MAHAVNQRVPGSSPGESANQNPVNTKCLLGFLLSHSSFDYHAVSVGPIDFSVENSDFRPLVYEILAQNLHINSL